MKKLPCTRGKAEIYNQLIVCNFATIQTFHFGFASTKDQFSIVCLAIMFSATRRNKRKAPILVDLVESAKKPKIESDYEEEFLFHFKQLFHTELTTMEAMIRNLLRDVTNKDK